MTAEERRLAEARERRKHWKRWGPYLSERSWGTVRAEYRYCDGFAQYAKDGIEDLHVRIEIHNRGPEPADLHLLPTLWFRNTWSWNGGRRPQVRQAAPGLAVAEHESEGRYYLRAEGSPPHLFTENDTNQKRLFAG